MSAIAKKIGIRLRHRRLELGYTQELTAEKASLHPTYIGQVERGEKNLTIESLEKICIALEYPLEDLFDKLVPLNRDESIANKCYSLVSSQTKEDQEMLLRMLKYLVEYKKNKL